SCPLCDRTADVLQRDHSRPDVLFVECRRCGRFTITHQVETVLKQDEKLGLASVRRGAGMGGAPIEILSTNIEQLLRSLPRYTPPEKLNNLLQLMAEMTPRLGEYSNFNT